MCALFLNGAYKKDGRPGRSFLRNGECSGGGQRSSYLPVRWTASRVAIMDTERNDAMEEATAWHVYSGLFPSGWKQERDPTFCLTGIASPLTSPPPLPSTRPTTSPVFWSAFQLVRIYRLHTLDATSSGPSQAHPLDLHSSSQYFSFPDFPPSCAMERLPLLGNRQQDEEGQATRSDHVRFFGLHDFRETKMMCC